MQNVTHFPQSKQAAPPMLMTPQDRIRAAVVLKAADVVAEQLLRAIKANPSYTLADLRSDDERGIFVETAIAFLLDPAIRLHVTQRLNALRAHGEAIADDEQEVVMRRARQDIRQFRALPVNEHPECYVCRDPVITNRVNVLLSDAKTAVAHGLCCLKLEDEFENIDEMTYRSKTGGTRG